MGIGKWLMAGVAAVAVAALAGCNKDAEPAPPGGPVEALIQDMLAGEWDAYGEIAAESDHPWAPNCDLVNYPGSLSSGYCWPARAFPQLQFVPESGVCRFYMLATGTPVRAVLSTDWLAADLQNTREEVVAEIELLAAEHPAPADGQLKLQNILYNETTLSIGHMAYDVTTGPVSTFEYDGAAVELLDIEVPDRVDLELLYIELDADTALKLLRQDVKQPKYLERGSKNQPATLGELAGLMAGKGAEGILESYDFSEFELAINAPPPSYRYFEGVDWQQLIYLLGSADELDEFQCDLTITDDDVSSTLRFSDSWYAAVNATTTEELNAEFDALYDEHGGGRWEVDSPLDELDSILQLVLIEGIRLSRKVYRHLASDGATAYFCLSQPVEDAVLTPAVLNSTDWHSAEQHLPPPSADAGELELMLRWLTTTPMHEVASELGLVRRDDARLSAVNACRPYSAISEYDPVDKPGGSTLGSDDPTSCFMYAYDDVYTIGFRFNAAWFERAYGASLAELNSQFDALYEQYGGEKEDYELPNEDLTVEYFYYGSAKLQRSTRTPPDAVEVVDFYVSPPSWNTLAGGTRKDRKE